MNSEQQKILMEKNNFKCQKCGYYSPLADGLAINKTHNIVLCSICNTFAPIDKDDFQKFLEEKIQWQDIETFRRFGANKIAHTNQKLGMLEKSKTGKLMARPPFGYKVIGGNLIIDEQNKENVRLIFEEFSSGKSMNQIAQTYSISVNGIKKILKNFTYLGKIKFAGNIVNGTHQPLISAELFNEVQKKLENKAAKKQ